MKEEFISKVHWIGLQLRILSDNSAKDEEEDDAGYSDGHAVRGSDGESRRQSMIYDDGTDEPTGCSNHKHTKLGKCCTQSSFVNQPSIRRPICVLRSHTNCKSMRKKSLGLLSKTTENMSSKSTEGDNLGFADEFAGYVDEDYGVTYEKEGLEFGEMEAKENAAE